MTRPVTRLAAPTRAPAWLPGATHALLRLSAGALFMQHGAQRLSGLLTRPVAFPVSGEVAVAYFVAHAPRGFWPVRNGGENVVLFCFVFLDLAFAGGGPLSADALRARRRGPAHPRP